MSCRIHFKPRILSLFLITLFIHLSPAQDTEQPDVREEIQKLTKRLNQFEKDIVPRLTEIEKQFATVFAEKKIGY